MKFFNLLNVGLLEGSSMMFIPEGSIYLGFLSAAGYSAVLGLILYYSPKLLGRDHFVLKSLFIGMVIEALFFVIFGTLGRNENLLVGPVSHYILAAGAALGGASRGYLIKANLFPRERK